MTRKRKESSPFGRPSKYHQSYCQRLIDHMTQGNAFETFAATLDNISRTTLYRWVDQFPEFKEAKAIGLDKSYYTWEQLGKQGTFGKLTRLVKETPKTYTNDKGIEMAVTDAQGNIATIKTYAPAFFNAGSWIFTMKNRFGWRDKVEIGDNDNFESMNFHDGEKIWDENKA